MNPTSRADRRDDGLWELADEVLKIVVDPDRGANILSISHHASGAELLWSPAPASPRGSWALQQGIDAFYDGYPGGIQELFPNAGPDCEVEGAHLVFHGEGCRIPWAVESHTDDRGASLRCRAGLRRYPFTAERRISLMPDGIVAITSTVTNQSHRALPVHWGFHPAFSESLTAEPAVLVGDFSGLVADAAPFGRRQTWEAGVDIPTQTMYDATALPLQRGDAGSADLAYATAHSGWYVLRSGSSGLAVGVTWPVDVFPRLWVWQECQDPADYPWWGRHHIVGIEPHSAAPSRTLDADAAAGEALMIAPGESRQVEFRIHVAQPSDAEVVDFVRLVARGGARGAGSTDEIR